MQVAQQPTPIQWWLSPWKRYALFEGRASRSEFWWFTLGQCVFPFAITVAIGVIVSPLFWLEARILVRIVFTIFGLTLLLFPFASILPSIAVTARRLHDIGQSGWLQLIEFIPIPGGIVIWVLCALPSQPHANQYGDAPLPPAP
jgi:uncharacterized membrane protein YhaH (DUF805 family)